MESTNIYEDGYGDYGDGYADAEPAFTDGPYWTGWCDGNEDHFYHLALFRRSQPHHIS
jgi:hypothetical protein